jgi:hypothetical protein
VSQSLTTRAELLIFPEVLSALCMLLKPPYERIAKLLSMSVDTLDRAREGKVTHKRIQEVTALYWEKVRDTSGMADDSLHYLQMLMEARSNNGLQNFLRFHRRPIEGAWEFARASGDVTGQIAWAFVLAYCEMW